MGEGGAGSDKCSFQLILPVELRLRLRVHKACTGEDMNATIVRATERLLLSEPPALGEIGVRQ